MRRCGLVFVGTCTAAVMLVFSSVTSAQQSPAAPADGRTANPGVTPVSATATTSTPATTVVLKFKFQSGQFVHYAGHSKVEYHTELEDRSYDSSQSNESGSHFRVVTVDEKGLALIEPILDRTRMTAQLPEKKAVVFDSSGDEQSDPQFQAVRDSIGKSVARFQVSPLGKLVKAIVVDRDAPKALQDAAERLEMRFPFLLTLPETPVSVGDKWREEYSVVVINEGLKQPVPLRRIYELTGVAENVAIIKFRTLALTPLHDPELEKQIIQQTPVGTIEFDIDRGLVRSYTSAINRSTINAFGPRSLLKVSGESSEKLVTEVTPAKAE